MKLISATADTDLRDPADVQLGQRLEQQDVAVGAHHGALEADVSQRIHPGG